MSAGSPPEAYAAALAGLERMTLRRLDALLRELGPEAAYEVAIGAGHAPAGSLTSRILSDAGLRTAFARSAAGRPAEQVWARCVELGCRRHLRRPGRASRGRRARPAPRSRAVQRRRPRPARRAAGRARRHPQRHTAGRDVAFELGRGLAHAGVHVMSGLARGIDGWAHRGVLDRRRRTADRAVRSPWSPRVSTWSTPASTGELWERVADRGPAAQRGAAGHRARGVSASRCATGSSPGSPRWSSWSSRANAAAR